MVVLEFTQARCALKGILSEMEPTMHEHRMILATADLSKVFKVVVARRKHASEVRQDEHCPRSAKVDGSSPSRSSRLYEEE